MIEEMVHAGDPFLDKNLTKGFLNKLSGKAQEIQNNRKQLAELFKRYRQMKYSTLNYIKNRGAFEQPLKNYNYATNMLNSLKENPNYYFQTGFLPYKINQKTTVPVIKPALA